MKTLNDCLIELGKAATALSFMNRSLYADDATIRAAIDADRRVRNAQHDVVNHPDFTLEQMGCDDVGTSEQAEWGSTRIY